MIQSIRFLSAALLLTTLSGCAAQKAADHSGSGSIAHAQAVKALEQRRFRIDIDEIFFHSDKAPISTTGSYLSLDGTHGTMRFTPAAFPREPLNYLFVEDYNAKFRVEKPNRKGNIRFTLRIDGEKELEGGTALVTLYGGSNRCLIQFWGADFRGRLYPLEE